MDPVFDTSMKAALDVFYWSNVACLTPNSGYMMIRRCTEMFAKNPTQAKTIRDAWAAVGVGCTQAAAQCSYTAQCCGALVCRKRTLTQTAPTCSNCAKPLELCFNHIDCCSPQYYKCLPSAAGSTRKVCKRG
jgi:hypothetical protein